MLRILFGADKKYMSYSHSATNAIRSAQFSLYILPFEISNKLKTIFFKCHQLYPTAFTGFS